ncbi:MAG: galactose-1-phosphate uridylyltransferase, partial [bacterium]
SPRHDLTLGRMKKQDIRSVVDVWTEQYLDLASRPAIQHVQIFENRGEMMGCSNPHPHSQIWANATLPNEPAKELAAQRQYHQRHTSCLLCDYLALEVKAAERLVCENQHFVALVPFWAVWPFEVLLLSRRHLASLDQFTLPERDSLADMLRRISIRYDNLFQTLFSYSMGLHQRPVAEEHSYWHFHAHYYPPLLRSATVRKFMVGYEMLASPQRDITPESAALGLRESSEKHFTES